jgi:hypothetical protein
VLGYESAVVNGQLVPIAPRAGYDPIAWGPAYSGPGMWPRQGVYNVPPILPSPGLQASMAPAAYGQSGSYPYPTPTQTNASGSPWSLKHSPVVAGLIALGGGLALLHFIHYR